MPDTYSYMLDYLMQGEESRRQLEEQIRRMTAEKSEPDPWRGVGGKPEWLSGLFQGGSQEAAGGRSDKELRTINEERFAVIDAEKEEQSALNQRGLDKLVEAGKRASAGREFAGSLDYEPAPEPLSNLGAGVAVGNMPADKLRKIRAEAKMKGAAGSLSAPTPDDIDFSGESAELRPRELTTVSNLGPEQTTEALQRYNARAPYDAAMSNLTTREIYERDPTAVDRSKMLLGMGREMREGQRQESIDKMVNAVSNQSGKIPFEMAEKLLALDPTIPIPQDRIGKSVIGVQEMLQREMRAASQAAQLAAVSMEANAPQLMKAANELALQAQRLYLLSQQPGADADAIDQEYKDLLMRIQAENLPTESAYPGQVQTNYSVVE